jgi:hypothetical protein
MTSWVLLGSARYFIQPFSAVFQGLKTRGNSMAAASMQGTQQA